MEFSHRDVRTLATRVHRLGLATNYGIDEAGIRSAIDRGINYFFYTSSSRRLARVLRDVMKSQRERFVVAAVPTVAYFGGSIRRFVERTLKSLGTEYIDVFQLGWLGVGAALTEGTLEQMLRLKEAGKVRALGTSIHNRARAGKLATDSKLDMLMIRYNAAHPGAERDIFPHLEPRHPMVVAYTATSWRKLLKRPRRWTGPVMTAGDCYRWCLSNAHVDVVLTGPKNTRELDDNLAAIAKGPLTDDEARWMREFGTAVHG